MDRELSRSVRILEDYSTSQSRSLYRNLPESPQVRAGSRKLGAEAGSLLGSNVSRSLSVTQRSQFDSEESLKLLSSQSMSGILLGEDAVKLVVDGLFMEFLEAFHCPANGPDVFDIMADLARCCDDAVNQVEQTKRSPKESHLKWLIDEKNTWNLISCLYQDRMVSSLHAASTEESSVPYFGGSEKLCSESLYGRDALVREVQLVIDWLECNASQAKAQLPTMHHFTDKAIGWENTLHQLMSPETIVFESRKKLVTSIDPDAPIRQKAHLHDLDAEDDGRLCRKIFSEIRSGKLDEAQSLAFHCGHPWRAAMLEGWKLYHDPNTADLDYAADETQPEQQQEDGAELTVELIRAKASRRQAADLPAQMAEERLPVEGNSNRDIWKLMAWKYCNQASVNEFEKASLAAFCGCLPALIPVCHSWEDRLWAHLRTLVDIRVESEIRDFVARQYVAMPQEYWDAKMSLDEVFDVIAATDSVQVENEAQEFFHLVQKFVVLDQIPQMLRFMKEWIDRENSTPHHLRFLAHFILLLKQINRLTEHENAELILESYVRCLMKMGDSQLVAFYVATLGKIGQVEVFAEFLENITDDESRKTALAYAKQAGLNIAATTKRVVENIIKKTDDTDIHSDFKYHMTALDQVKISCLDWVLYESAQRHEALYQSNTLISYFLLRGKVDAARLTFDKLPPTIVDAVLSSTAAQEEVPAPLQLQVREHLSYKALLDAHDAFNEWFRYFHHSRPHQPPDLPPGANFTEKVAHEHRVAQFASEKERWNSTMHLMAKRAKTQLYNVLLFPDGGWLAGAREAELLQSKCIPEVVTLIYSIMSSIGADAECMQLANVLASEKHQLYRHFSTEKLSEIIINLADRAVVMMDAGKDSWNTISE